MALTFEQAKNLRHRDRLMADDGKRWYVNGSVQLWKRPENAGRIRVPLKHGLYQYGYIDEHDFVDGVIPWLTKEA